MTTVNRPTVNRPTVNRQTKETDVTAAIGDGVRAATGLPFLDHMLTVLGTYAGLGLQVDARP